MKTCVIACAAVLLLCVFTATADDFYSGEERQPQPARSSVSDNPSGIHELGARDEPWTWRNLFYGPMEILASPFMLFMGPVAGASAGYDVFADPDDTTPMAPVRGTVGAIGGGLVGLFACPAALCVGVFDTLTGGAFCDNYFFYDVDL